MIKVAPGETPVTMPDNEPMVATPVDDEVHVPPPASYNVVVEPIQVTATPVMGAGIVFTVRPAVEIHPPEEV